jgi:hypothetical protein
MYRSNAPGRKRDMIGGGIVLTTSSYLASGIFAICRNHTKNTATRRAHICQWTSARSCRQNAFLGSAATSEMKISLASSYSFAAPAKSRWANNTSPT